MYFPILRGRQFELLALKDCVDRQILSPKVIPIIEPVKISSTLFNTINSFISNNHSIAIIRNPQVGSWTQEANNANKSLKEKINNIFSNKNIISSLYLDRFTEKIVTDLSLDISSLILLCDRYEGIDIYESLVTETKQPKHIVIPGRKEFERQIKKHRILCEDHFQKQARNKDYLEIEYEPFSSDHLWYKDEGYEGFSDYSIVGGEFKIAGFAPRAVAIHLVYFNKKKELEVAHFVSDNNEDILDPAEKFAEALNKLIVWNEQQGTQNSNLNSCTVALEEFKKLYKDETYPGLGVIKKLSMMHHFEIMSRYLDGEN